MSIERWRHRSRADGGQAAIEFIMMMPLFLIFMLLVVEFGLLMWSTVSLTNASREGARFGAANCAIGSCTAPAIKNVVIERSGGILQAGDIGEVTVAWPDGKERGDNVHVSITHAHNLLFLGAWPGLTPGPFTVSSCAKMRLESADANTEPPGVAC